MSLPSLTRTPTHQFLRGDLTGLMFTRPTAWRPIHFGPCWNVAVFVWSGVQNVCKLCANCVQNVCKHKDMTVIYQQFMFFLKTTPHRRTMQQKRTNYFSPVYFITLNMAVPYLITVRTKVQQKLLCVRPASCISISCRRAAVILRRPTQNIAMGLSYIVVGGDRSSLDWKKVMNCASSMQGLDPHLSW